MVVYKEKFETVTEFLNIYAIYISLSKNSEQKTHLHFSYSPQILLIGTIDWTYYRSSAYQVIYIYDFIQALLQNKKMNK